MERIKQALERAKAAAPESTSASGSRKKAQVFESTDPVYQQTRWVDVSVEHLRRHRIISEPKDPILERYKIFRTRVIQEMDSNGWRSVGVTSPRGGAGKTVTAINLAISLSKEVNHTVFLLELNLRRPKVGTYLFTEKVPGTSDFLSEDRPLSDYLICPGLPRLIVLPGGSPVEHSSDALMSPKMQNLAKEAQDRYASRIVVYDLPSILECDDVLAFAPHLDAVLMVVEEGATTTSDLAKALESIKDRPVLGILLNKAQRDTFGSNP